MKFSLFITSLKPELMFSEVYRSIRFTLGEYLTFNKRERNGMIVLLVIIILLQAFRITSKRIFKSEISVNEFEFAMNEIEKREKNQVTKYYRNNANRKKYKEKNIEYFNFDPNTISVIELNKLGFSTKQAQVIDKFRTKGARFDKPEDFKACYVVSDELYANLFPYIKIEPKKETRRKVKSVKRVEPIPEREVDEVVVFYLNQVDSIKIQQVKGIGSFYAKEIVKYREKLGGFYRVEQLLELWKMDSTRFKSIAPFFKIKDTTLRKIQVNSATFKQLIRHPYLDYEQVKIICNHRKRHGAFNNMNEFSSVNGLCDTTVLKLGPYISFQ